MSLTRLIVIAMLLCSGAAFAQGTQQPSSTARRGISSGVARGGPVATQPSNNPFKDPIGQGVPPATSTNRNLNGNRTSVPMTH
jgi:hypothetical protein